MIEWVRQAIRLGTLWVAICGCVAAVVAHTIEVGEPLVADLLNEAGAVKKVAPRSLRPI